MGTFGKAAGSFGAYVACNAEMKEYLINFCAGLIYSTALPPAILGAIDAALELIPSMQGERARLAMNSKSLREDLISLGFDIRRSSTHIIPIVMESDERALKLAQFLQGEGIFAPAIRPPAVPEGSTRIRLSMSAAHTAAHIEQLLESLKKWTRVHG